MKTPTDYIKNLNDGIITSTMLSDVLFSYSKRAKNYRDKKREYLRKEKERMRYGYYGFFDYDNSGQAEINMSLMYRRKDNILKRCGEYLKCIHKHDAGKKRRIYDYQKEYNKLDWNEVVWSNCYYDHDEEREVYFADILDENKTYLYFAYYEFPNHGFHNPINEFDIKDNPLYNGLEVIDIGELETYGENVNDLLSLQFCDKVYKHLMGGNFNMTIDEINHVVKEHYVPEGGFKFCAYTSDLEIGIARYLSRYSGVKLKCKNIESEVVDNQVTGFKVKVGSSADADRLTKIGYPRDKITINED